VRNVRAVAAEAMEVGVAAGAGGDTEAEVAVEAMAVEVEEAMVVEVEEALVVAVGAEAAAAMATAINPRIVLPTKL
jgi:hypothetical protein